MARFRFGSKHKKKDQHSIDVDPDSTTSTTASSITSEKKRTSKRFTSILSSPLKQTQQQQHHQHHQHHHQSPQQVSTKQEIPQPVPVKPMPLITPQPRIHNQPPPSVVSPWKRYKLYDSPFLGIDMLPPLHQVKRTKFSSWVV